MIVSLYRHRDSPLHRMTPGLKLSGLPILATVLFATSDLRVQGMALLLIAGLYGLAKFSPIVMLAQIRPVAPALVLFCAVQFWIAGPEAAALVALRFGTLVLAAALVTSTTRSGDMIEALEAGLGHLAWTGIDPSKVGLAIALVLRFIPVLSQVLKEVREAQAARGRGTSLFALGVPVVLRTLKMADEIAEAIDARS